MEKVYVVKTDFSVRGSTGNAISDAYVSLEDAIEYYEKEKASAKSDADVNGFDQEELDDIGFDGEGDDRPSGHYEVWLDGDWMFNHITVELTELKVVWDQ